MDRYGRIVLPKEIRDQLGIRENTELTLDVRDDEIVLRVWRDDLNERVNELIEFLRSNAPKAFVSEVGEGEKWFTNWLEKIGLKE